MNTEHQEHITELEGKLSAERKVYYAKFRRKDVVEWMKKRMPEARYFLSLTFSDEVTYDYAHKAAKTFQHEVSKAIAGKHATKHGRYAHPMAVVLEQQKKGRWHLHVMMEALPVEYDRITSVEHLKSRCAQLWQKRRYKKKPTEKFLLIEQRKNSVDDFSAKIAGEHSPKWFQELMTYEDIDRCFDYITKTYIRQGSDFLAATY